jgi:hypothetical protein|tara:strand:+ start:311 stop:619 length:309 start_codon:yes stop_codon:yes gene_type:complete
MSKNRLPLEVIDYWPEIFEDIEIKAVPVKYISGVKVSFTDGKTWEIDLDKDQGEESDLSLEETLNTFFKEYNNMIKSVQFKLDTPTLVNDVKTKTKTFMKRS